jgi:hypothetical protein
VAQLCREIFLSIWNGSADCSRMDCMRGRAMPTYSQMSWKGKRKYFLVSKDLGNHLSKATNPRQGLMTLGEASEAIADGAVSADHRACAAGGEPRRSHPVRLQRRLSPPAQSGGLACNNISWPAFEQGADAVLREALSRPPEFFSRQFSCGEKQRSPIEPPATPCLTTPAQPFNFLQKFDVEYKRNFSVIH